MDVGFKAIVCFITVIAFDVQKNLCEKGHPKRQKIGFQYQLSLKVGQKYCRMLHSAILPTFIKLSFLIKIFVLSIFEWPLNTGFTEIVSLL